MLVGFKKGDPNREYLQICELNRYEWSITSIFFLFKQQSYSYCFNIDVAFAIKGANLGLNP